MPSYAEYLKVDELLALQCPLSEGPEHDEMLFIVIHQVYELWFKQLLHELERARDAMSEGTLWWAQHLLQRVAVIEGVLVRENLVCATRAGEPVGPVAAAARAVAGRPVPVVVHADGR